MPKVSDFWESYRADEFVVEVGGRVSPGITKVTGLSEGEIETIEQPDPKTGLVHKIASTKVRFDSLTLERNVDGSAEDQAFRDWFGEIFQLSRGSQGSSAVRRSGMIYKFHNGEKVLSFAFYHAWVKSSKFTDLEAGSTALFKQTIVLEHEGLERVG